MPIEVLMPALSPTMTEGNLANWLKKEGDNISAGDVIAEIETDKATMEVESVDEGVLKKIFVAAGSSQVKVNTVIAVLAEEGDSDEDIASFIKNIEAKAQAEIAQANETNKEQVGSSNTDNKVAGASSNAKANNAPVITSAPTTAPKLDVAVASFDNSNIKASPLAKKLAKEHGVDLNRVKPTGPAGRIVKEDVEDYLRYGSGDAVSRNPVAFSTQENSMMRKTIAKRLLESKQQVPHFYLSVDFNIDDLLSVRKQVNSTAPKDESGKPSYKISVNDMIIKACALALKDNPDANASWYDDAIVKYNNVDISVAVATDGGLITPIIFNADQKSLLKISAEMKELAKLAKDNKLKPEQFQGGGFSISNLGMFGIKSFSAIINPPQSCILAVGAGEEKAIVANGSIKIANIVNMTLSVDHRSVDGAVGAMFLSSLKRYIENPASLLL